MNRITLLLMAAIAVLLLTGCISMEPTEPVGPGEQFATLEIVMNG